MTNRKRALYARLQRGLEPDSLPGSSGCPPAADFLNGENKVRDEILKLVQRLFITNGTEPPRLVVFAGVEHGNGCTSICARAGELLSAFSEAPVCLIDANPFAPGLFRHFGMKVGRPISTMDPESWRLHTPATIVPGKKLWLTSCTDGIADIPHIMDIDRYRARLLDLCSRFSFILIDAPPVSTNVQTLMFGRMADGMVLVLEANVTRREAALRARGSLESAGVRLLGVVLNKRTYPIPELLYRKL